MKTLLVSLGLLVFSLQSWSECSRLSIEPLFKKQKNSIYFVLDLPRSLLSEKVQPPFPHLQSFQENVRKKVNPDAIGLLKRQRGFFKSFKGEVERFDAVISGRKGKIRKLNCLETLLMETYLKNFSEDMEFEAYVLTYGKSARMRILFQTQNERSIQRRSFVDEFLRKSKTSGWNLMAHVHSHPFSFENPFGDISGTILPSQPDLISYQQMKKAYGLDKAVVINGFDALELQAREFGL